MTLKRRLFFILTPVLLLAAMGVGKGDAFAADADRKSVKSVSAPADLPTELEQQTELLIKTLVDKGYAGASSPQEIREIAPATEDDIYKQFAFFRDVKADKRKVNNRHIQKFVKSSKLHEGDSIYRVAVSDKVITLDEAIQIALGNNLGAKATAKKIEVARAKVTEARRALFPTAQIVTELNGGKAQGNSTNLGGRLYKGKNWKVNFTQPVFYGGELVYTVKQAETSWKSAIEEYKKAKLELIQQVQVAYLGAVKNIYNLDYQTSLYRDVEALYRRVRSEHQKKLISDIDYLNAESEYYQVFFQLESAKNESFASQLILYENLGLDVGEPLPLDLNLEFKPVKPNLYEVLELAMRQSPDIRIKQYAVESAEFGIKIWKAKKLPKIDLRGSYGMLGEVFKDDQQIEADNADLDQEKEWFLGMGASMPLGPNTLEYEQIKHKYGPTILALQGSEDWKHKVALGLFDKLSDVTDTKSAEATYLQAQAELDKAKNDAIIRVRDEFYNLQKSLIQIDSTLAKMRYQDKQVAAYRFLVGLQETTVSALIEGMLEQASNKFGFIQAVADYHAAVAGLNAAIGDPEYFKSR